MWMFNIGVVCLIAGILGNTFAQNAEEHVTAEGDVWTHGLKDVFLFLLESGKGLEHFREDCNKQGGAEAYNNLAKSAKDLSTLILAPYMNGWEGVEVGCSKFSELSKLNKNLLKSYKNCLEPKTRDNVDDDGVVFPLLGLLCDISENDTMNYYQINYECIPRHCIARSYSSNYYSRINIVEFASHLLTSDLRREECQMIDEVRSCIIEPLKSCNDSTPSDIAKAVFGIIDKHTSCDKFLQVSAAPSAAATGVESSTASSFGDHVVP